MTSKRVTLVADELRGLQGGGIGTATSHLAIALGRTGHDVNVLYIAASAGDVSPEWKRLYDDAGVHVRMLERRDEPTVPSFFGRMRDIALALQADPSDVVIAQDLGAPAYFALRSRQLGLALEKTLFVLLCHGTRRWITDVAQKVRVLPGALAITLLERAAIELSDVVVSPSAYLVDWMRDQRWRLPERTTVIPYLTRSGATGETRSRAQGTRYSGPVERIAFFGRLEERKGIRNFVEALDLIPPALLQGLELEFVGMPTKPWPPSRVRGLLSVRATDALSAVRFETELDQQQALERLSRPGTLAVMPSLEDNSPNTVYECLELGIAFVASRAGGTPELIAPEDRDRVLFEPTPDGIAEALRDALAEPGLPLPARAAVDDAEVGAAWAEVVTSDPSPRHTGVEQPPVDAVVVRRAGAPEDSRCMSTLGRQHYGNLQVVTASDRASGVEAAGSAWLVLLEDEDELEPEFLGTMVRAQQASGADVVTCSLHSTGRRGERFFLGEPGGLGILENGYGTVALIRRSLLSHELLEVVAGEADPDWRLLARLSLSGASIVSVPLPLATRSRAPGRLERNSVDAALVLREFESAVPRPLDSIARLAAGLTADAQTPRPAGRQPIVQRVRERLARSRG